MKKIPAHILWPGIIILLILSNIVISVTTLTLANSDGGVTVVDDAYVKDGQIPMSADSTRTEPAAPVKE